MKKIRCIVALFMMVSIATSGQDITGKWEGPVTVSGTTVRFVMKISKAGNVYKTSFDIPDQNAFGIPAADTKVSGDSIMVQISAIMARFTGKWDAAGTITGVFMQGPVQAPLVFKRQLVNRPQTPKPPFNYDVEEVEYDNADKTVHYGATLTKPRNSTDFPTVIIISGSGSQDRDGTLFGHKLYAVLADHLTSQGIGVLRVDDRGMGKSTIGNDPASLTSLSFEKDVETSLDYLLARKDINRNKVGLIGHSEGGIIAPMVAARRKEIAFLALWGAPAIGGASINVQQNMHALKMAAIDSTAITAFAKLHQQELSVFSTASKADFDNTIAGIFAEWKAKQDQKTLNALYVSGNSVVGQDINKMYHSLYDNAWMRFFLGYDPAIDLRKVTCPVLAFTGEKDTQVSAGENLPLIYSILTKSGNKKVQIVALPSLNHLLQTAKTGDLAEYDTIEETMSPIALNLISNWIKTQGQ